MGRKYKRKSDRGCDLEPLKSAAEAVRKGEMSTRKAVTVFQVPRTTLQRFLSKPEADHGNYQMQLQVCQLGLFRGDGGYTGRAHKRP